MTPSAMRGSNFAAARSVNGRSCRSAARRIARPAVRKPSEHASGAKRTLRKTARSVVSSTAGQISRVKATQEGGDQDCEVAPTITQIGLFKKVVKAGHYGVVEKAGNFIDREKRGFSILLEGLETNFTKEART
jgi:hypothetical protein